MRFRCIDGCADCCAGGHKLGVWHFEVPRLKVLAKKLRKTLEFEPWMGFGRSKDEKPSAIAVYRMKNKTCPFLEIRDFQLRCAIYEHRPLVCQAFPVIALNPIRLSANCRVLRENLGEKIELDGLESEIEAMTVIYAHMRRFPGQPRFFENGSWK